MTQLFAFELQYRVWNVLSIPSIDDPEEIGELRGMGLTPDGHNPCIALMGELYDILKPRFGHGWVNADIFINVQGGEATRPLPWEQVWRLP